ncbi:hypothetical protein CRUP_023373 [Coryphaenoides rupestris]|nr:hypothetical protein CRUP_023373 [Coryphaenoides rupestris]
MKIRKYFRGSGRVLAFVFIASVIWLLFDMAALRLSMSDTTRSVSSSSSSLKALKERMALRSQTTRAHHGGGGTAGFRHPVVQRGPPYEGSDNVQLLNKVAQAYRRKRKNQEYLERQQQLGRNKSNEESLVGLKQKKDSVHQGDLPLLLPKEHPLPGDSKKAVDLEEQLPLEPKKAVDLEEQSPLEPKEAAHKGELVNVTDAVALTKVPKAPLVIVQEDQRAPPPTSLLPDAKQDVDIRDTRVDSKANIQVQAALKDKAAEQEKKGKPAKPYNLKKKEKHDNKIVYKSNFTDTEGAAGQSEPDRSLDSVARPLVAKRKSALHKVYALDMTSAPRDAQAVGQYGNAAKVPSDKALEAKGRWAEGHFNVFLSDQIPLDRAIPDTRPQMCSESIVHDDLPTTSVIFCFVDEVWSTLLRSVHSVLNRSPAHLLTEIILVDDCSTREYLGKQLDDYMRAFPKVLTFLDSHVECNVGWLEPLLERRGIFKWPLVFGWNTLSEDYIKKNKMTLGAYDPGLDVWGGENMEISFKIWMCGGEIEIIPCSRVGHIFRGQNPYKFPKDRQKTVERNLARVAEVWLDEYKELFYGHGYQHLLNRNAVDIGDLTEQVALRKRLNCTSFKWYLENVYSDVESHLVKAEGLIFNLGLRKCLAIDDDALSFATCDIGDKSQHFNYTWLRLLHQRDACISPQDGHPTVTLEPCDSSKPLQRWFRKPANSPLHLCLEAGSRGSSLRLDLCEPRNRLQKWQFTHSYAMG